MYDLNTKWPGTIILIAVFALLLGSVCALCAYLVDPALPRDVRAAGVTVWAVTTIIAGLLTAGIRHME